MTDEEIDRVPETVTEAVELLHSLGYDRDLILLDGGLSCRGDGVSHALADATVEHTFRFEGESDPGDEAIVLGIKCCESSKGVLVAGYSVDIDPEKSKALKALAAKGRGSLP